VDPVGERLPVVAVSSGVALDALDRDAERERLDPGGSTVVVDAVGVPVDGRALEEPVRTLQEVFAVRRVVEAEEVVAEQSVQQVRCVGRQFEHLRRGPGDVPEVYQPPVGHQRPQHPRRQREVVVLEPDQAAGAADGRGRLRELPVDRPVALPVVVDVVHLADEVVTQRPEHLVAEPQVVPLDLAVGQPDAPEFVRRVVRRYRHAVAVVDGRPVGVPVAPGHPGAARPAEHLVQRLGQAADRPVDVDLPVPVLVAVRLAVRHDDEVVAAGDAGRRTPVHQARVPEGRTHRPGIRPPGVLNTRVVSTGRILFRA
jgi:hypothetical protein